MSDTNLKDSTGIAVGAAAPAGEPLPAPEPGRRRRSPRSRWVGVVVFAALGGLMLGVLGATLKVKGGDPLSQQPSGPAPDFTLPLLQGEGSITLSDLRGHPILLNFWASWCVPCKQEAPVLAAGWRKWRDAGVIFLGVDTRDSRSAAIAFEEKYGVEYQSVVDETEEVNYAYGVTGFPESFFIDSRGRIVGKYVGPMDTPTLDAYVSALVAKT
jgi:cytochrome c biogenesis protein CcmG, thiol:disulfide interchange protein DsbE